MQTSQPNYPHSLQTAKNHQGIRFAYCPRCELAVPERIPMTFLPSCKEPESDGRN